MKDFLIDYRQHRLNGTFDVTVSDYAQIQSLSSAKRKVFEDARSNGEWKLCWFIIIQSKNIASAHFRAQILKQEFERTNTWMKEAAARNQTSGVSMRRIARDKKAEKALDEMVAIAEGMGLYLP